MHVRLQPRAKREGVVGERADGSVAIRVIAPPVDGRANEALIAFLAKRAGVPRGAVRIVAGHSAREKLLEIEGLDGEQLRKALFPGG